MPRVFARSAGMVNALSIVVLWWPYPSPDEEDAYVDVLRKLAQTCRDLRDTIYEQSWALHYVAQERLHRVLCSVLGSYLSAYYVPQLDGVLRALYLANFSERPAKLETPCGTLRCMDKNSQYPVAYARAFYSDSKFSKRFGRNPQYLKYVLDWATPESVVEHTWQSFWHNSPNSAALMQYCIRRPDCQPLLTDELATKYMRKLVQWGDCDDRLEARYSNCLIVHTRFGFTRKMEILATLVDCAERTMLACFSVVYMLLAEPSAQTQLPLAYATAYAYSHVLPWSGQRIIADGTALRIVEPDDEA